MILPVFACICLYLCLYLCVFACFMPVLVGVCTLGSCDNCPMTPSVIPTDGDKQVLVARLRQERAAGVRGGIYHRLQVEMTYNSNHIEGSQLTQEQTRLIFETSTVGGDGLRVDDIVEARNHFRAIDRVIDAVGSPINEAYVKDLHRILKQGTTNSDLDWFAVGDYKQVPNEVTMRETSAPGDVAKHMAPLFDAANRLATLEQILDWHVRFERIHPFQDGNGRVGRLLMLHQCLAAGIVPFIITDDLKGFYYRGLERWGDENGFLTDTCLSAQDRFVAYLEYFQIPAGISGTAGSTG